MIKNEEAKTSVKMRIIVLAIAIFMLGSTFALYAGLVLNYNNPATTSTSQKQKRFEELYTQYQEKLDAQAAELSNKYFSEFSQYRNRVKSFNAASVGVLTVTDLKVGTGRELADISDIDYAAYYIGWLSNETIFDSSFDNASEPTALVAPLEGSQSMIQGWLEGIARSTNEDGTVEWEGMRIGGIREISIPATLGYGATEKGDIPANSPLKFVVMLIEKPEEVEVPAALEQLYVELYGE